MDKTPASPANIVETALQAGRELGQKIHSVPVHGGKPFVILCDENGGDIVEYLDTDPQHPHHIIRELKTLTAEAFVQYFNRFKGAASAIYANDTRIVGILNDHQKGASDYADHRVALEIQYSNEWKTWKAKNLQPFGGNVEFAHFIENNLLDFQQPSGAAMLKLALNFEANSEAAYSNAVRLEDGTTKFHFENTVTAKAGAETIPNTFKISIPVHKCAGEERYEIDARFRYRLQGPKLSIWYELIRPDKVLEEANEQLTQMIGQETGAAIIRADV
jgi:uncharacterized protein YfdQ (DUF2303 family)